MKLKKLLFTLLTVAASMQINAQAPAFPGAEGYARYTTSGGRGQSVYHVTNLNDSGTGSFRDAVSKDNRIIVFDVSGYIDLKSDLKISKSNLTIAGQTAPGDGITLRYYTVVLSGNNIIMRFLRFRRSQVKDVNDGADASWGRNKNNIILDHCSFSWSIDEIASFYDNRSFTMQWCTLSEALANPGHSKGEHSYGGIWGGKDASFHHNFLSNMQNRVPRFNGARYVWDGYDKTKYENTMQAERVDFRNCVMYNWGTGGCYGGPGGGYINMINNYYKAGPGTLYKTRVTTCSVANSTSSKDNTTYWGYFSRYYIKGNYVTAAGVNAANYDWNGVVYDSGLKSSGSDRYIPDPNHYYGNKVEYKSIGGVDCVNIKLDSPIECNDITTHTAENAYEKVLAYAGASLSRDAVDARYMEEARTGTTTYTGSVSKRAGIVDMINNPSGTPVASQPSFPELKSEKRASGFDSDNDGMPDEWEKLNGLNPNNASDGKTYTLDSKKYYTNLEVYLNSLVEHIIKNQNANAETAVDEYFPPCVATGITSTSNSDTKVVKFLYYDLSGKQISKPGKGISIRKLIFSDGTSYTDKVIKK